jgi:hypothetical protein
LDYSTIIDRLTEDIRQYRIESQRFFTGDSQVPPEELREQIRKRLTSIIGQPQLSSVEQFRLSALESRYHSLTELFRRRLRDHDLARRAASELAHAAGRSKEVELATDSGVEAVEGLYRAIYAERSGPIDIGAFHAYLQKQAAQVRDRTGCDKVRFSVDSRSGAPKLKAKPVRSPSQ